MEIDYRHVIAETPYDSMGTDFQEIFGRWVNETKLDTPAQLNILAYELFKLRLSLAQKYKTYFAKQVTEGGQDLWANRFVGIGNLPCYSFASINVQRTKIFWHWSEQLTEEESPNGARYWDLNYADYPRLPVNPDRCDPMMVWSHTYNPIFTARTGGSFECRRILYGYERDNPFFLFEHPRNRWISQIRSEASTFWNIAFDSNNNDYTRFGALASFEWLWYWMNPFMRSGAMTGDALSLVMQKRIGAKSREFFYHQDCEALLLPFDAYVVKRITDMTDGFVGYFDMNCA
jgi:hypothetical protein